MAGWAGVDQVMIYAHLAPSHVAAYSSNSTLKNRARNRAQSRKAA
jgi:hypothetical protein